VIPKEDSDGLRFLCRHLVSFGWIDWAVDDQGRQGAEPRVHCQSGFIMSFQGCWVLATAGHVIEVLESLMADPRRRITNCVLIDAWSHGAICRDPIPFDLVGAPKIYEHSDAKGLDFGFISIRPYYRRQLEANGIVEVDEQHWKHLHEVTFTSYGVLGIPQEQVSAQVRWKYSEPCVTSTANPVFIPVAWVDDPPAELLNTICPRFIGRLPDEIQLESIVGMSGGPIFGFREEIGSSQYWIVAIQSSWWKEKKLICGCLLPYIGALVQRDLEQLDEMDSDPNR
jgi:hypothetical protein